MFGTGVFVGVIVGVIVGGLLVGVVAPRFAIPAGSAAPSPGASAGAAASPGASGGAGASDGAFTADAITALRGTADANGRLVAQAEPLAAQLAAGTFVVADAVKVLRQMSTDARVAGALVKALDGWRAASAHEFALAAFYIELSQEISEGLAAPVTDPAAYKATITRVLTTLRQVVALDAESRTLAAAAGIQLPPIVIPAAVR
jgi:hypothetical protein